MRNRSPNDTGRCLSIEACQSNRSKGSLARGERIRTPWKLAKVIDYFEKAPEKTTAGQEAVSLSLQDPHSPLVHVPSYPGSRAHAGPVGTGGCLRLRGLQRTKL